MTGSGGPLRGRTVLLTRPVARTVELGRRLARLGACVVARPTFCLRPPADPDPARQAVERLDGYDWIVFTSANGVRFFAELACEIRGQPLRVRPAVAAIGPATARELERLGCSVELVADESRSEGLAAALAPRLAPGRRVLLVRPEEARAVLPDALRGAGVRADAVAFYRNLPAADVGELAREICANRFDVVLLSSPSSLAHLLHCGASPAAALLGALGRARLVAIGPVTAHAIEQAGLEADAIAARPTDDAIVAAVRSLFD